MLISIRVNIMGILPDDNASTDTDVKKLEKGRFRKFFFRSYHQAPSIKTAIFVLSTLGVIFIIIGSVLISYSESVQEYKSENFNKGLTEEGSSINITLEVKKKMKKPVFLYFKIDDYYQNHRIYSLSKSVKQLQGNKITKDEAELSCVNYDKYEDMDKGEIPMGIDESDVAYPCGLIAKTFVNDKFELFYNEERINIEETKITWDYDRNSVFKNYDTSKQWQDFENGKGYLEHFIVWMKTAALEGFKKLWGRIEKDLEKGKYTITVTRQRETQVNRPMHIVLATANEFGGKNLNLGILYLVVGVLTISSAIYFAIRGLLFRKPDDFNET